MSDVFNQLLQAAQAAHRRGDFAVAESLYRQILSLPGLAVQIQSGVWSELGVLQRAAGRFADALASFRRAVELDAQNAAAWANLAGTLGRLRRADEALQAARQAIALDPNGAGAWNNLGLPLLDLGDVAGAAAAFAQALKLSPNHPVLLNNMGNALREQGRMRESIEHYRSALRLEPNLREAHDNLLFSLYYDERFTPDEILREHRAWDARFAAPLRALAKTLDVHRDPDRRLRIGFVSPDLRDHPVGRFLLPLFAQRDRVKFDYVCFSSAMETDAFTGTLRANVDEWHDVAALSDDALADAIRAAKIDVLLELALHSKWSRLLTFVRRPAPVQVSFLGYPGTTGVAEIDFRLTDPHLDPPGNDAFYSEKSVRLAKSYWCYSPPEDAPEVSESPAGKNGFVTFGGLNKFAKAGEACLATWAALLGEVPGSRLILHAGRGVDVSLLREAFDRANVSMDRVELVGNQPYAKYLATYGRVDIALDPFPYCGGTTTCDALWMGVPVVTLAGQSAVQRAGVSVLTNAGRPEWIAGDREAYLRIARGLASDVASLVQIRATMRQKLGASALMDAAGYARDFEAAIRLMWSERRLVPSSTQGVA